MNAETKSALIVTSTLFYNVSKTNKEFKSDFLTTFCIEKFFDLSPVRRLVFNANKLVKKIDENGNIKITKQKIVSPASIVYFSLSDGELHFNNTINHQSVKSNHFLKHFKILVIEKYDQKKISQKHFIENDWMFKLALYGNTLDYALLIKLQNLKTSTVLDLIDNKTIFKGAGIERGENPKPYPELIGMPVIENKEITQSFFYLKNQNILKEENVNLSRGA